MLINSAEELKNYSKDEEKQLEEQIQAIVDAGVKVVVTSRSSSAWGIPPL